MLAPGSVRDPRSAWTGHRSVRAARPSHSLRGSGAGEEVIGMFREVRRVGLGAASAVLLAASPTLADRVAILDTATEALAGRIHLLESAERSIDVLYFALHDDEVTRTTLALLREKALAGVRVRIVTNPRGFPVDPAIRYHLQTLPAFEIRVFDKPVAGRIKSLRQLHDKLLLVDSDAYISGGRNLGAAYFDLSEGHNKKDRDLYVEGSSAQGAQDYFDQLWQSREVSEATFEPFTETKMAPGYCQTIGARADSQRFSSCQLQLEERRQRIEAGIEEMETLIARARASAGYRQAVHETGLSWRTVEDGRVRFVHDPVEAEKVGTALELARLTLEADRSVLVQTPYMVPTQGLLDLLAIKQREGVPVEVVTNSVRSSINLIGTAATERYKKKMVDLGAVFYESTGNEMLHAKSGVYRATVSEDGGPPCWGVVGSYNIDPRSARLNTETIVVVRDCGFVDELEGIIRSYAEDSVRVASRDDLAASKALKKGLPLSKRFALALLKLLAPLYRSQV